MLGRRDTEAGACLQENREEESPGLLRRAKFDESDVETYDKNALPSPEEMRYAKDAIATLEDALREACELIESVKLRVMAMKRDLEERRGWIAPIRKIPAEILVDILLHASEMDDLGPVKFTAVSKLWRQIILATPKAWSFIHLGRNYNTHAHWRDEEDYDGYFPGYKTTYFKRSEPGLLHLSLPKLEGFYPKHSNSIIKQQAHRIQCLTTSTDILRETQSSSRCQQFPYLQTLVLTDRDSRTKLDTSFFSNSRFPALQTLHWPRCLPLTRASPTISSSTFPPLQHLTVDIGAFSAGIDILQSCAATLKSLSINRLQQGPTTPLLQITFPLLRCLTIGRDVSTSPPTVRATTPVLTSFVMASSDSSIPAFFDADMQKVTHMRWGGLKVPSICTHVRFLQIKVNSRYTYSPTREYAECASKLKEIAGAYPSLETIEVCHESEAYVGTRSMQQTVKECLGEDFVKPKLLWTSKLQDNLPGYVATTCGEGMPCDY